jgi:amidohydrolase
MIDFPKSAKENLAMMIEIRRELHKHPEIDRNLNKTALLVEGYLNKWGIKYKRYENNGIIADIGRANSTNIIALRADMDALQIIDLKDVDYKSQNEGVMHACGHDAHTAILLGTACILKNIENELNGKIRLIFQPAEETDGGAKEMIAYGALEGAKAIIGLHVEESIDSGVIGVNRGVVHAASNPFKISINGKGSHGASPQDGIDSIYIASKIIDGLQGVVSREISATDSAVITIGKIYGGTAINAICSNVILEGILRTLGSDLRNFTKNRIKDITCMTAAMYRGNAEINFIEGYPSFENDKCLGEWFNKTVIENTDIEVIQIDKPSLGVEDFAYYTQVIPGFFYKLGCRNIAKGIVNPAHGSFFDIDENCLEYGALVQSMIAYEFLKCNA